MLQRTVLQKKQLLAQLMLFTKKRRRNQEQNGDYHNKHNRYFKSLLASFHAFQCHEK